jgi:hypothetical protein
MMQKILNCCFWTLFFLTCCALILFLVGNPFEFSRKTQTFLLETLVFAGIAVFLCGILAVAQSFMILAWKKDTQKGAVAPSFQPQASSTTPTPGAPPQAPRIPEFCSAKLEAQAPLAPPMKKKHFGAIMAIYSIVGIIGFFLSIAAMAILTLTKGNA